jgi:hypothetical protein
MSFYFDLLPCRLVQELLAIEGTLDLGERRKYYEKLDLTVPLEFDEFDAGPSGGIQVIHPRFGYQLRRLHSGLHS